jgi:hypothetical protein
VYYDLNNDGVIDSKDYALKPPRLSPWSYGVSLRYNRTVANSDVTATFSFNHRDGSFYDDKNAGFLNAMDQIDAKLAVRPGNGHTTVSVYVKNALNRASYGGDTQLPDVAGFGGDGTGPRAAPPSRAVERPGDRRFDPVRVLIHPCRAAAPSCCRPAFAILRGAARDPTPLAQPLHHGGQDRTAPGPPTMPAMFRAAVAQGADRPAIHYFDTTYSFGDLDRLSDGLATALAEGGLPRRPAGADGAEHAAIRGGAGGGVEGGGVAVTINPMNRAREVGAILADCTAGGGGARYAGAGGEAACEGLGKGPAPHRGIGPDADPR